MSHGKFKVVQNSNNRIQENPKHYMYVGLSTNTQSSNFKSNLREQNHREKDNMSKLIVTIQHPPQMKKSDHHHIIKWERSKIQTRKKNKKNRETHSPQRQNWNLSSYNQPDPAITDEIQSSTHKKSTPDR